MFSSLPTGRVHLGDIPTLLRILWQIRRHPWLPDVALREIQWCRLKDVLHHAYTNVPFYRDKFTEAGVNPEDIQSPADLRNIPVTTRSELQEGCDKLLARPFLPRNCLSSITSGSTGQPFTSYFDKEAWLTLRFASKLRARFACGLRMRDRIVMIDAVHDQQDGNISPNIFSRAHILSVFGDLGNHVAFYKNFAPDILYGFGSYFLLLADFCSANHIDWIRPRLIFTGREFLDHVTRRNISGSFRCPVYDIYGSTELKEIAWECRTHEGYHINNDLSALGY